MELRPEDIFFSVTDGKGVISHANATFMRLAALDPDQVIGAPHNIIRHPDMPGGLFHLMWQELASGRPVAAYTANRGGTGVRYDVFALVTPVADGFLSVRLRPGMGEVERAVHTIYDEVAAREAELREGGAGRREAAEQGAALLLERLGQHGYATITDFTRQVLPRELAASLGAIAGPASAHNTSGVGTGVLVSALFLARDAAARIDALLDRLADYERLAEQVSQRQAPLEPAVAELAAARHDLGLLATRLGAIEEPGGQAAEAGDLTVRMHGWAQEALTGLERLPEDLALLREAISELGLRISTSVLLGHTVAQFIGEVLSAGQTRGEELRLLVGALEHSLESLDDGVERVRIMCTEIPARVEQSGLIAERIRLRLELWQPEVRAIAERGELGDGGDGAVAQSESVASRIETLAPVVRDAVELSTTLRRTAMRLDTATVRSRLTETSQVLAQLP